MKVCILPSSPHGTIKAIASKSAAHRLLICAAFADKETVIRCEEINEDITATVRCLNAIGAKIVRQDPVFRVTPVGTLTHSPSLDCGESGSTLRFLLPLTCMLGLDASFVMAGRLPQRPLSPLREELEAHGIRFSPIGSNPLLCKGKLEGNRFSISGSVSSQFISGLLFALAISGKTGIIEIEGKLESAPYVDMTMEALAQFGLYAIRHMEKIEIRENNGLRSPGEATVEGDWSNAAFSLCLGALGKAPVTVCGLNSESRQGDQAIVTLLKRFGALAEETQDSVTVSPARLCGIEIDASQIPDLVPILATVASVAEGKTVIRNAARLRIKESDRLVTVRTVLNTLGANVSETEDGLIIYGKKELLGGTVSSFGDHRIAMSAAVASVVCHSPVTVENAQAAAKSYPAFWDDMAELGLEIIKTI